VQSITILGKECAVADEVRVQNCVCLPYKELKRVSCCKPFRNTNPFANRFALNRMCKTKSSCKTTPMRVSTSSNSFMKKRALPTTKKRSKKHVTIPNIIKYQHQFKSNSELQSQDFE
jgi:hypothetical protein